MVEALFDVLDERVLRDGVQQHTVTHSHVVLKYRQRPLVQRHGCGF